MWRTDFRIRSFLRRPPGRRERDVRAWAILYVAAVAFAAGAAPAAEDRSKIILRHNDDAYLCYEHAKDAPDDPEGALRYCSNALNSDSLSSRNRAATFVNRAITFMRLGKWEEALADVNDALKIDRHLAEAYFNRGNVYIRLGRYRKAIRDYSTAISQGSKQTARAYYNRGLAYGALGRYERAYNDFAKAQSLAPDWKAPGARMEEYRATHAVSPYA